MKLSSSRSALLVVVSALLYATLLPPFAASLLAWVALVPLLVVLVSASPLRALALELLWALVATLGIAWWFPGMLERFFDLPAPLAWLALLGLGVLIDGLPYAAFALWIGFGARRGVLNPLTVAGAWGIAEWLRGNGPVANPFAQLAYSQAGTPFAQASDLAGPYAIGMLVVSVNVAIAGLFVPALGGARPWRRAAIVGACVLLTYGYGLVRLQQEFGEGESVRVALVQGAVAREPEWDRATRDANLDRYLELTSEAASLSPQLVFWPEFAVDFYLSESTVQRARLFDGVRALGADLVLGGSHYRFSKVAGEDRTDYFNSVFVVDASGRLRTDRYDKRRLVPFAEYGPFGDRLRASTADYVSGEDPQLLAVRGLTLGAFICGEVLYPEIARELARSGAQILANPSNDYWFGHPQASAHQLQVAAFRAIENRRYLVRPTSTGISAVVDAHGRVLTHSLGEGPEVLHARVRASSVVTIYQRIGDLVVAVAAALVLSTLLLGRLPVVTSPGGKP